METIERDVDLTEIINGVEILGPSPFDRHQDDNVGLCKGRAFIWSDNSTGTGFAGKRRTVSAQRKTRLEIWYEPERRYAALSLIASFFLVAAFVVPVFAEDTGAISGQNNFHAAATLAEKTLDAIFKLDQNDGNLFEFVLGRPFYDPSKDSGYSRFFTKPLLKAMADVEKKIVHEECGGKYSKEELCGIEYSPITCEQDSPDKGYLFRTERANVHEAVITSCWPDFKDIKECVTYRMIKDKDRWKLDGIRCQGPNGERFNMK